MLEVGAELRLPLAPLGLPRGYGAYGFVEAGSALGSGPATEENPTLYYRKAGRGASWGAGVRFQGCRRAFPRVRC